MAKDEDASPNDRDDRTGGATGFLPELPNRGSFRPEF